ncbi:hypothetical protein [Longimicrobium sp.]|uniref:hypothetical protein n=1 Tax=Longimicrobium sp. TaxID=2029185 RepID=UPI002BBBFC05|nr:hypothetical protein [Longimicrobium sp.]HSU15082.1 hypothetical protein [Longimicrobium sp.]
MLATAATLLLLASAPADTTPAAPLSASVIAGAYRDPAAREMVRRAREYRRLTDRSVRAYRALARERSSAGLRTVLRNRMLFGRELAARIDWRREGAVRVELLGARSRSVGDDDDDNNDVREQARSLAFDPADDRMRMGLLGTTWIRHPLAEGSERDYRFRAGDTLTVRLSGGETVRVFELRVEPRRLDAPLVSGSIWLEDRSYGVVRTLLRLSHSLMEEIRSETHSDSAGRRQVNVGVQVGRDSASGGRRRRGNRGAMALLPDVRIDVRYVATEYGLVQGKWWMPTLNAIDATVTAGSFASVPVRFERSWSEYQVEGDPIPAPGALAAAAPLPARADTPQACRDGGDCLCALGVCRTVEVQLPADTTTLASSPDLPPPLTPDAPLLSGKETDELAHELNRVATDPWIFMAPTWRRAPFLLRYNRVEALSVGVRQSADFGALQADGTLRIATATGQPDVEIGVRRESARGRLRLAGYRRLAAANPLERPLGIGNSLGALLWGRDNGDYFRATGVELLGAPPRSERPWMEWRLFAEHQGPVATATDFSLRGTFSDFDFRPNVNADRADQAGAALTLRPLADRDVLGVRWGLALGMDASAGTFRFARPSATLRGGTSLLGLDAALEGAAGTSLGDVPAQSLWRLGGAATLRGYDGSSAAGTAFWRGRGELARGTGAARLALFSDVGWAGARGDFAAAHPLWSVGAGVSVLDGLFRVDLARALRSPTGWRLELYMDGPL